MPETDSVVILLENGEFAPPEPGSPGGSATRTTLAAVGARERGSVARSGSGRARAPALSIQTPRGHVDTSPIPSSDRLPRLHDPVHDLRAARGVVVAIVGGAGCWSLMATTVYWFFG